MIKKINCKKINGFSLNLVDEHNHLLGIDDETQCCELFCALLAYIDQGNNCVVTDLDDTLTKEEKGESTLLNSFEFTGRYYEGTSSLPNSKIKTELEKTLKKVGQGDFDGGEGVLVEIINQITGDLGYISIHNFHNGYYSHALNMVTEKETIFKKYV